MQRMMDGTGRHTLGSRAIHVLVLQLLLDRGARFLISHDGGHAVSIASSSGCMDVALLLIRHGAQLPTDDLKVAVQTNEALAREVYEVSSTRHNLQQLMVGAAAQA